MVLLPENISFIKFHQPFGEPLSKIEVSRMILIEQLDVTLRNQVFIANFIEVESTSLLVSFVKLEFLFCKVLHPVRSGKDDN